MRISDWSSDVCSSDLSPHMANEARFESLRYFLSVTDGPGLRRSVVKDLRQGMGGAPEEDRNFLHQYLAISRCDLFFADKAVLTEGTAERISLTARIRQTDTPHTSQPQLNSRSATAHQQKTR